MKFEVEKPKTWKGLSYVLKSSVLQNEIIAKGLDCNVHLIYTTPQGDNKTDCLLIRAEYWLPNQHVDYYRFYITTGVVPSSERKRAETILNNDVLPALVKWMESQLNKPNNSTVKDNEFNAFLKNGKVLLNGYL